MAQDIVGSKMPTYPSKPRPAQKFYRGATSPTRDGYGENGYTGPSSVTKVADSDRLSDVEANNEDAVRDALIAGNQPENSQTRDVSDKLGPVVYGQTRQTTPSRVGDVIVGKLPATSGASAAPDPKEPN